MQRGKNYTATVRYFVGKFARLLQETLVADKQWKSGISAHIYSFLS